MGCTASGAAVRPHSGGDSQHADKQHSLPHALPSGVAGSDTTHVTTAWTHAASATVDPASPSSTQPAVLLTRKSGTFAPPDSSGGTAGRVKDVSADVSVVAVVADERNLSFSHTSVPGQPHSSSSGAENGSPVAWNGEQRQQHTERSVAVVSSLGPSPTHVDKYSVREHVATDASTLSLLSAGALTSAGLLSTNTLLLGHSTAGNILGNSARTDGDSPPHAFSPEAQPPGVVLDVAAPVESGFSARSTPATKVTPSVLLQPVESPASLRSPAAAGASALSRTASVDVTLLPARFVALPLQCYEASHECKVKEKERGYKRVNELVMLDVLGRGAYGKVRKARIDAASIAEYREALQQHGDSGSEWVTAEQRRLEDLVATSAKLPFPHFVAVKIVRKSTLRRKRVGRFGNALQSVMREADVWKRLQHPHVLRLLGTIDDASSDKLYFVSELMEGGSVMPDAKTAPPLHPSDAARYTVQLLDALTYLHRLGVLHRDVKPGNCLLSDDGRLCLADFGTVHVFEGSDDTLRSTAGTPSFLAPEMLTGGTFAGRGQDAWAAGMTVYMMLHGCTAFAGDTLPALYESIRTALVPWPQSTRGDPAVDEAIAAARPFVMSLLERDVSNRSSVETAAQHEWLLMHGGVYAVAGVRSNTARDSTASTPTMPTPASDAREPPALFAPVADASSLLGAQQAAPIATKTPPISPVNNNSPLRRRSVPGASTHMRSVGLPGPSDDDPHRSPNHAALPPLSPTSGAAPVWSSARDITSISPSDSRKRAQLQRLQVMPLPVAGGQRNKAKLRQVASTENAGSLFVSSGSEFVMTGPSRASPPVSEDSEHEIGAVVDSPHGSIASLNYSVASAMVSPASASARATASRNASVYARPSGSARSATRTNTGVALPGGLAAV